MWERMGKESRIEGFLCGEACGEGQEETAPGHCRLNE